MKILRDNTDTKSIYFVNKKETKYWTGYGSPSSSIHDDDEWLQAKSNIIFEMEIKYAGADSFIDVDTNEMWYVTGLNRIIQGIQDGCIKVTDNHTFKGIFTLAKSGLRFHFVPF